MGRFSIYIIVAVVAMGAVLWAVQAPDEITFQGPGFEGATSRAALTLIVVMLGAATALIWWLIGWTWDVPGRIRRTAQRMRTRRARESIAEGLLAIESQDAQAALRALERLKSVQSDGLGTRRLALLLRARAQELNAAWLEAERAYYELAREPGGELAGLKGLATVAVQRGDLRSAALHAEGALKIKSAMIWPAAMLLDIKVRAGEWLAALDALNELEKRGGVDADGARRRRAVLLTAEAERVRAQQPGEAERLALDAVKQAAHFAPAALLAARLSMTAGRAPKAQALLETAWTHAPHPALAIAYGDLRPEEEQRSRARRMRILADFNPDHRESRILLAESAVSDGDWESAALTLGALMSDGPTARLCALMEAVARGQGLREEANRWARLAMSAAREPDWSDIDHEGRAFRYSIEEWGRQVRAFGEQSRLIHPRHEGYGRELGALARIALPAPQDMESQAGELRTLIPVTTPLRARRGAAHAAATDIQPPAADYAPDE